MSRRPSAMMRDAFAGDLRKGTEGQARRVVAATFEDISLSIDLSKFKISNYTKHFSNPRVENMYRRAHLGRTLRFSTLGFLLYSLSTLIMALADVTVGFDHKDSEALTWTLVFRLR
jgi:hypothetical protein